MMTAEQKEAIAILRGQRLGYSNIAARLGIPENTIKTHCRRNGITASVPMDKQSSCLHCGTDIEQRPKCKPRKFCSDACRTLWWNSHLLLVSRKAYYEITCAHCGTVFQSYGNKKRKFCCNQCYVNHRYNRKRKET